MAVTRSETADDSGATDGGVDDRDDVAELCFKSRVEVRGALDGTETV